ncbi:hypothetical protein D7D52_24720 [Nocardia yunnanensis]|uniref:Uncharacterized protein n=1 Tax=Nocardia yunnanensis TaxID=2382165 RepID=A0A386ZFW7_9NOCA|nr:hypothetical protein D7D52_24720 [Nocardia yunnanensis]
MRHGLNQEGCFMDWVNILLTWAAALFFTLAFMATTVIISASMLFRIPPEQTWEAVRGLLRKR